MWSLKFSLKNIDTFDTLLTSKYDVTDYMYPTNYYRAGKNKVFIEGIHVLEGKKVEIDKYAEALRKNKKTVKFQRNENVLIIQMIEEEDFYDLFHNPKLFYPSPAILKDGFEKWHIASWNREDLEVLMKSIEKNKKAFPIFKLHSIEKSDLKEVYFPKLYPELPEQQKKAFQLALKKGYYFWPRKVDLDDLAKEMKISSSTYHEHLRKAESKLLPFFASNTIID